jgi:hypothetical protein
MTWIKTIKPEDAEEPLKSLWDATRALYPAEYHQDVQAQGLDESQGGGITQSHSLIPPALYHAFGLLGVALSPELPLTRSQHEMIATVVSSVNRCFY